MLKVIHSHAFSQGAIHIFGLGIDSQYFISLKYVLSALYRTCRNAEEVGCQTLQRSFISVRLWWCVFFAFTFLCSHQRPSSENGHFGLGDHLAASFEPLPLLLNRPGLELSSMGLSRWCLGQGSLQLSSRFIWNSHSTWVFVLQFGGFLLIYVQAHWVFCLFCF